MLSSEIPLDRSPHTRRVFQQGGREGCQAWRCRRLTAARALSPAPGLSQSRQPSSIVIFQSPQWCSTLASKIQSESGDSTHARRVR